MAFLHARTGHDFSSYKRATVMRLTSLKAYANYLAENPEEAQEPFGDLLISVTSFFRDPPAFEALVEQALSPLFRDLKPDGMIRIWSVGCATGEEAYSIAILAFEEAERLGIAASMQIFATDLDGGALKVKTKGRPQSRSRSASGKTLLLPRFTSRMAPSIFASASSRSSAWVTVATGPTTLTQL